MIPEDTIVAISTPPGRGGIGVVRLSGTQAIRILRVLVRLPEIETQRAALGEFADPQSGKSLDRVVVTCFRAPHSYTGQDVVEISCHGAPVILEYLVLCCVKEGARPAEPGEFTMRAFLNGRIDLAQAEAIRDLIDARTLFQARVAAQQMEGSVARSLKPLKQGLAELIALLEAGIDFGEDDVPVSSWEDILSRIADLEGQLVPITKSFEYGRIIREGLSLAIGGRPNVGKSSLFNRLLNEDRAIVTEIPGTTRDLITETASLDGIPLRLVDTAGIRETTGRVEKMGMEKSFQAIADSSLRLLVVDASEGWTEEDQALFTKIQPLGPMLIACNKSDLPARILPGSLPFLNGGIPHFDAQSPMAVPVVWTSALTGEGVSVLREKILSLAHPARETDPESDFITSLRHQQAVNESLTALAKAREAGGHCVPHEMLLLDLYDALHALDSITGETAFDDLLGIIFSRFCVGK
ncbi:MAG: tRNA uridine-5-carboxymethylaminomethyl(34) synthesis GTPase MnmE [Terriglobia bacterium]